MPGIASSAQLQQIVRHAGWVFSVVISSAVSLAVCVHSIEGVAVRVAELMLWWGGGRWWIGKQQELGLNRGWIKAEGDGASPPAKGWVVYSSRARPGMWKAATELSCRPAERLEASGLAEGTPHADKLGVFVR